MPNELLPALKGAPISILLVLCDLDPAGPPLTAKAAAQATGYCAHSVGRGLAVLARLGLAEPLGHNVGWRPTPAARQLCTVTGRLPGVAAAPAECKNPAPECNNLAPASAPAPDACTAAAPAECNNLAPEGKNLAPERKNIAPERENLAPPTVPFARAAVVVVDKLTHPLQEDILTTTTTPAYAREDASVVGAGSPRPGSPRPTPAPDTPAIPPVDPAHRLAELLVTRAACPRHKALPAVRAALDRGARPEQVELDILTWDGWLNKPGQPHRIAAPGLFIAAKLRNAEPPPPNAAVAWPDYARAEALRRALASDELRITSDELRVANEELRDDELADDEPADDAPADAAPPEDPLAGLWTQALAQLRVQLPRSTCETWLADTALLSRAGDAFVVQAPNSRAREWLAMRLRRHITRTLSDLAGCPATVTFVAREPPPPRW